MNDCIEFQGYRARNGYGRLRKNGRMCELRIMRSGGATYQQIAERFGITAPAAHKAATGITWKNVA